MDARQKRIGSLVASAREAQGHGSQRAFANAVGVSERSIAGLERGERFGRKVLGAVERVLGWPPHLIHDALDSGDLDRLERAVADSYAARNRVTENLDERVVREDDDFEVQIMALDARPIEERWQMIIAHRKSAAAQARSSETRPDSSIRRTG